LAGAVFEWLGEWERPLQLPGSIAICPSRRQVRARRDEADRQAVRQDRDGPRIEDAAVSISNDTPYDRPIAKVGVAHKTMIDEAVKGTVGSMGEFRSSEEFARFLQRADQLERDGEGPATLRAWLDLAEAWRITQALRSCKGNRSAAARMLGIGRRTLYSKMEKLGIVPTWGG